MARYRVRERNIRLWGTHGDGSEFVRDFTALAEARAAVPSDAVDWTIFKIDDPNVAGVRGPVLASGPSKSKRRVAKRKRSYSSRSKTTRTKPSRRKVLGRVRKARTRLRKRRHAYATVRSLRVGDHLGIPDSSKIATVIGTSGDRVSVKIKDPGSARDYPAIDEWDQKHIDRMRAQKIGLKATKHVEEHRFTGNIWCDKCGRHIDDAVHDY